MCDRIDAALSSKENKDAGGQRHNIEQENGRPDIQAEPQKAINDQVNREQNHPDIFSELHGPNVLARIFGVTMEELGTTRCTGPSRTGISREGSGERFGRGANESKSAKL